MENQHTFGLRFMRERLYYTNVPDLLWDFLITEKAASRSVLMVYMTYLRTWNNSRNNNIASISAEQLANKLKISKKSVNNANKTLEKLGLIERRQETRYSQIDNRYSSTAITTPRIPDQLLELINDDAQRDRIYKDPALGEIGDLDGLKEKIAVFEKDQSTQLRTNAQRLMKAVRALFESDAISAGDLFDPDDEIIKEIHDVACREDFAFEEEHEFFVENIAKYLASQICWSIYSPDGQLSKTSNTTPKLDIEESAIKALKTKKWKKPRNFPPSFIEQCFPAATNKTTQKTDAPKKQSFEEI